MFNFNEYNNAEPLDLYLCRPNGKVICVLNGSIMFASELIKYLNIPIKFHCIKCSSYEGTASKDLSITMMSKEKFVNKNILLIEDIIDTGKTIQGILNKIGPMNNVVVCTLLDKSCCRLPEYEDYIPDYFGFEISDKFVVGYGLDYNGYCRELPFIASVTKIKEHLLFIIIMEKITVELVYLMTCLQF